MSSYIVLYFTVSLAWLVYFSSKRLNLSSTTIGSVFLAGAIAAPFAGLLTYHLKALFFFDERGTFLEFVTQFLLVGPIEELAKFLAVFIAAHRRTDFNNSFDGILLSITAALGFAGIENALYLSVYGAFSTFPRLLLGNLGHAAYSAFWGYALAVVLCERSPFSVLITALVLSSILHGLYNYLLGFSMFGSVVALIFSGILIIFLFQFLVVEKKRNIKRVAVPTYRMPLASNQSHVNTRLANSKSIVHRRS